MGQDSAEVVWNWLMEANMHARRLKSSLVMLKQREGWHWHRGIFVTHSHVLLQNYRTVTVGISAKLPWAKWTWAHLRRDTRMQGLGGAFCVGWFRGCLVPREKVNARGNGLRQECSTTIVWMDTLDGWDSQIKDAWEATTTCMLGRWYELVMAIGSTSAWVGESGRSRVDSFCTNPYFSSRHGKSHKALVVQRKVKTRQCVSPWDHQMAKSW